ncbi:cyclin-like protein [Biscogniauxia mediterranea]|nr:cyclin-like protein [Biscogniauxia mediterranea]
MAHMTNPLATVEQLYRRTSFSALPSDLQDAIFFATQCLTQAAGILLRIPQSVTAQANVILARYWLVESPLTHEFSDVSAAVLFLVAKLSSHPCPPRDVCNVYAYLLSPHSNLFPRGGQDDNSNEEPPPPHDPSSYYLSEAAYTAFRGRILALEGRVLHALSFDTHVALPHALAITYLQALDFLGQPRAAMAQRAVEHLNTALLSPQLLYLTHQPNALAVAAIYSAARDRGAKMPECPWWEVFDVDREELGFLVVGMRSLEGLVRKQRAEHDELARGAMITRASVEAEMRKRGLRFGNGAATTAAAAGAEIDEEAAMMRSMDEKAETMEQ